MSTIILTILLFNLGLVRREKISQETLFSSANGKFLYSLEYATEGVGEIPIKRFSLYDKEKRLLFTKTLPGEEAFFVSDAGWLIGIFGSHPRARLTFYDLKGSVKKQVTVDYPYGYSFSLSGNLFYVNTPKGILAFNSQGKIVYRFNPPGHFFPSSDDKFLAVIKEDSLFIFRDGKIFAKSSLSSLLFRHLAFSPDNKFLAVAEKHSLSLFSVEENLQPLWQKEFNFSTSLLKIAVDNEGIVYLAGEETKEKRSGFLMALKDGITVSQIEIPYLADYETILGISFLGDTISVRTTENKFYFVQE